MRRCEQGAKEIRVKRSFDTLQTRLLAYLALGFTKAFNALVVVGAG